MPDLLEMQSTVSNFFGRLSKITLLYIDIGNENQLVIFSSRLFQMKMSVDLISQRNEDIWRKTPLLIEDTGSYWKISNRSETREMKCSKLWIEQIAPLTCSTYPNRNNWCQHRCSFQINLEDSFRNKANWTLDYYQLWLEKEMKTSIEKIRKE
jgi:hypothetical protein